MKRTATLKLQPSKEQEKTLFELADTGAKLWNEVNYLRRQQFFNHEPVDFNKTEKIVYEKYKREIGSATVQQIARKNAEAWRSFFSLIKKRKELPKWLKPKPPNYLKEEGRRKPLIVLRNDQYRIEGNKLILKGLGKFKKLEVQFKGRVHLKGKQGRLEIVYDDVKRKWYAHISFNVEEKLEGEEWIKLPRKPKGNLSAGIDLGVNNLMAVYVENGESFLVNGRPLKSTAFYWQKRISEYQSKLNRSGCKKSRKLRRMHERAKLQARHYVNTAVRQTVRRLYDLGVSRIVVGFSLMKSKNPIFTHFFSNFARRLFFMSYIYTFENFTRAKRSIISPIIFEWAIAAPPIIL